MKKARRRLPVRSRPGRPTPVPLRVRVGLHHLHPGRVGRRAVEALGVTLSVQVTDSGDRAGTDVPQAYLTYPTAAGEPPGQLVAFQPVTLAAHASRTVSLFVPWTSFRAFVGGTWTTVPGRYLVSVDSPHRVRALTAVGDPRLNGSRPGSDRLAARAPRVVRHARARVGHGAAGPSAAGA